MHHARCIDSCSLLICEFTDCYFVAFALTKFVFEEAIFLWVAFLIFLVATFSVFTGAAAALSGAAAKAGAELIPMIAAIASARKLFMM